LPYGKQRLLEIALAFACRPAAFAARRAGRRRAEAERHELLATIAALPAEVTVLLIEHDMDLVFSFADRISVLVNGSLSSTARRKRSRAIRGSRRSIWARRPMRELLRIAELSAAMGEAVVLSNVSVSLAEGTAVALLGRNGMGKTTLVNTVVRRHPLFRRHDRA